MPQVRNIRELGKCDTKFRLMFLEKTFVIKLRRMEEVLIRAGTILYNFSLKITSCNLYIF